MITSGLVGTYQFNAGFVDCDALGIGSGFNFDEPSGLGCINSSLDRFACMYGDVCFSIA
jgi:hypothetical protein